MYRKLAFILAVLAVAIGSASAARGASGWAGGEPDVVGRQAPQLTS